MYANMHMYRKHKNIKRVMFMVRVVSYLCGEKLGDRLAGCGFGSIYKTLFLTIFKIDLISISMNR